MIPKLSLSSNIAAQAFLAFVLLSEFCIINYRTKTDAFGHLRTAQAAGMQDI